MAEASSVCEEQEYECQYLTFDRKYLKECLKGMVEEHIHRQTRLALQALAEAQALSPEQLEAVSTKLARLTAFFCANADQPLQRIHRGIDRHLSIPRHVTLPEDEDYGAADPARVEALRLETETARNRALAANATAQLLSRELESVRDPSLLKVCAAADARIQITPPVPPPLPRLNRAIALHFALHTADHSEPRIS